MLEIVLISGQVLECSLAKPQADEKAGGSNSQKSALLPNYPPRVGYGLVDGAYGGLGAQYGAAGFAPVSNVQRMSLYSFVCSFFIKRNLHRFLMELFLELS